MIEIIVLYFLTKSIGTTAVKKGLPPARWKIMTVVAWLVFEMTGLMLGIILFGTGNPINLILFGLVCAFGGYLTIRYILENKPDDKSNDADSIGIDQLRP
jgi:hypothetical protein